MKYERDNTQTPAQRRANLRTALILGFIAVSSLCIASYGITKTLAMGG